jgi:periplasmic protein CpxP/Spy
MKQQMRAIHKDTRQQFATILTPDQLQQLRASHHRGHGAPNQAQPPANPQPGL